MKLLTKELLEKFKKTWKQEWDNPLVICKFFNPTWVGTWFATEFNEEEWIFFWFVDLLEKEWWYFSLSELQNYKWRFWLGIEREIYFDPVRFEELY